MYTAALDGKFEIYSQAINDLASFDTDYAREQNDAGFNKFDAAVGHALADMPFDEWGPAQLAQARRILTRYKNTQLPRLGYFWDELPEIDDLMPTRDAGTRTPGFATIAIENGKFTLRWGGADPYFKMRVDDARNIQGSTYDKVEKAWRIPVSVASADAIAQMMAKYAATDLPFTEVDGFRDGVDAHIDGIEAKLRASAAESVSREMLKLHRAKDADKIRPFQLAGIKFAVENKQTIIADDMGCVSKDTVIPVSRGQGMRLRTIEQLYKGFNGLSVHKWDASIPTYVRALKDDRFGLHEVKAVLDKGRKPVVRVILASGKSITCTPDHEIRMFTGEWVEAGRLASGDEVTANGVASCKECGSTENVSTYKYAKFVGYCRTCMYRIKRAKPTWKGGRALDKDGYVRLSGHHGHPEANKHGQILEHRYVMEQRLGRVIGRDEVVHHINGIRDDNRVENLSVMSAGDHMREHDVYARLDGGSTINGGEVIVLPRKDTVVSVEDAGVEHVYDIVMADPYRNFVANGIVVHNCGKTVQSILTVLEGDALPCLVVCPSSLKLNWKREIEMWAAEGNNGKPRIQIADGVKGCKIDNDPVPIDFLVLNYDIVHAWQDEILSQEWKAVICDESHYLKTEKTRRTKAVMNIIKKAKPEYRLMLTGTPILNKPIEIWPILGMVNGQEQFGGWYKFALRYCGLSHNGFGYSATGATNLGELNTHLRSSGLMIRRRKEDVLKELPDKQWATLPVEMAPTPIVKAYQHAESDLAKFLRELTGQEDAADVRAEALQRIAVLRQLAWRGKEKPVREFIDSFLESGKKLIVFGWHREAVLSIADHYNAPYIMGGMNKQAVEDGKERFQNDPDCKIIVCNIAAGGVGHTLTAASDVLFIEYAWNYALMDQAISRAHRIGQKDTVTGWMVAATLPGGVETIDHEMIERIQMKEQIVKQAIDGDIEASVMSVRGRLHQLMQDAEADHAIGED